MAFTNPILSGEELNRTGIRSENYVPGASGWRIASDGAAEFDNVGIRGNLWVPSITLGGQDLATRLDALPKGLISFINGYPNVSTTSEARFMVVDAQLVSGRYYEAFATNITTDNQTGTDSAEFKLRWDFNGNVPTNSSDILCIGLRQSIFQIAVVRAPFWSGYTGLVRIGLFLASLNGSTVHTWAPGNGCTLGVIDHGKAPYNNPGQGIVGSGGGARVLKEWTITANESRTYHGNGTLRTDGFATTLVMGDWANGLGNQRAWWTFSNSDVNTYISDLVGVPQADIVTAEVRLAPFQYSNYLTDSGYISLGFHNTAGGIGGGNEPGGGIPNVHRPTAIGDGPMWININPNSGAPSNFIDSMRDGYLKGFMVGNTFGGDQYAIVCQGTGGWTYYPQLHMKYWKNN